MIASQILSSLLYINLIEVLNKKNGRYTSCIVPCVSLSEFRFSPDKYDGVESSVYER